jgi:transcription initiation factor TFIID subunit TAF12
MCPEEMQMILDAAAHQMHTEQQAGPAEQQQQQQQHQQQHQQQQQQQQRLSFEQQLYMQGQMAAPGMLADSRSAARKLVRPSLCSDAGTGSPQAQAATAAAAVNASPGVGAAFSTTRPATDSPAGMQCVLQHIKQEPHDVAFDGAGQSYMQGGCAGSGDGARTVGRRFVLDLSDDGLQY